MSEDMNIRDSIEATRLEDQIVAIDCKIDALKQQMRDMQRQRDDIAGKYVAMTHPIKVGDHVRQGRRETVFRVSRIVPGWRLESPTIFARRVLKDGALSVQEFQLWGKVEQVASQTEKKV